MVAPRIMLADPAPTGTARVAGHGDTTWARFNDETQGNLPLEREFFALAQCFVGWALMRASRGTDARNALWPRSFPALRPMKFLYGFCSNNAGEDHIDAARVFDRQLRISGRTMLILQWPATPEQGTRRCRFMIVNELREPLDARPPFARKSKGYSVRRFLTACTLAGLGAIVMAHAAVAAVDDDDSVPKTEKSGELEQPTISGPLKADPHPASFTAGPIGKINVTGVVTGYGLLQSSPSPDDRTGRVDFSNLQMIIQKGDGPVQFYLQTGIYSIPSLGIPNSSAIDTASQTYGFVPLAYTKIKLNDDVSLQGGQMPSLFSGERTFTFQNMNVEQGLLFNQANNINKGLQIAYSKGPAVITASLNDGFYSDRLTWLIGSVVYKLDDENRVSFSAGANLDRSSQDSPATPLLQNNSSIYNITYGYKSGPWIISPYTSGR